MANNSVRGATEVATQYTDLHLHRHIDSPLVRKFDESWRHLLSLLRPPLQQFTNQQTPTSSSRSTYSTAESAAAPAIAARSPKARRRTGVLNSLTTVKKRGQDAASKQLPPHYLHLTSQQEPQTHPTRYAALLLQQGSGAKRPQ